MTDISILKSVNKAKETEHFIGQSYYKYLTVVQFSQASVPSEEN